jgi:hypothetical protein
MTDPTAEAETQPKSQTEAQAQAPTQPSEEELRAAYEAELNRITSADLLLQTVASLLNLGARRLGLTTDRRSTGSPIGQPEAERDLEQVRDAIDGVRALMPILERCNASEVGPLRDALSQLQMAYAREAQRPASEQTTAGEAPAAPGAGASGSPAQPAPAPPRPGQSRQPGPAESSGRLWVPGR